MSRTTTTPLNGTLKFVTVAVAILGLAITLSKLVWGAAGRERDIKQNTARIEVLEPEVMRAHDHFLTDDARHEQVMTHLRGIETQQDRVGQKQDQILSAIEKLKNP